MSQLGKTANLAPSHDAGYWLLTMEAYVVSFHGPQAAEGPRRRSHGSLSSEAGPSVYAAVVASRSCRATVSQLVLIW